MSQTTESRPFLTVHRLTANSVSNLRVKEREENIPKALNLHEAAPATRRSDLGHFTFRGPSYKVNTERKKVGVNINTAPSADCDRQIQHSDLEGQIWYECELSNAQLYGTSPNPSETAISIFPGYMDDIDGEQGRGLLKNLESSHGTLEWFLERQLTKPEVNNPLHFNEWSVVEKEGTDLSTVSAHGRAIVFPDTVLQVYFGGLGIPGPSTVKVTPHLEFDVRDCESVSIQKCVTLSLVDYLTATATESYHIPLAKPCNFSWP